MTDSNRPTPAHGHVGFRLIDGLLHRSEQMHGVLVVRSPEHRPPFGISAMVAEEDTCLVLSAPTDIIVPPEHPIRVMTEVHAASPLSPGTVVVRSGSPLRFLAVVHDLDEDPTCSEAWVAAALDGVLDETEARGLQAIGLPMIGTLHGTLSPEHFVALLSNSLRRCSPNVLRRIWLVSGRE